MVIYTKGNASTDNSGYEIKQHGTTSFPLACYYRRLDDDPVSWHYHAEFEIIIKISGEVSVLVPEKAIHLTSSSVCFLNSGELHSMASPSDGNNLLHSLVFSPRLIGGSSESVFYLKYIKPLVDSAMRCAVLEDGEAYDLIESVYKECLAETSGYEMRVRNLLSTFLLKLLSLSAFKASSQSESEIRNEKRIKQMLSFIQERASSAIEVEDIAGSASISRRECLRCFRQTLGTTPSKYLSDYRLEKAAEMLRSTKLRVIDISTECGFEDTSYFTRVFSKKYGMTPRDYRKRDSSASCLSCPESSGDADSQ